MSKKIAYYALHYGVEYLAWSIRSIQDCVDEIHVLYTDTPSFGHNAGAKPPGNESEERLLIEAHRFLKDPAKLRWHRVSAHGEGRHRMQIEQLAPGSDICVHVDADEIWDTESLHRCIERAESDNAFSWRAHFVHFWRSFDWVCVDPAMPERVFNWNNRAARITKYHGAEQLVPVLHFGYAQSEALMKYKWTIHGHQPELRRDWFREKFLPWTPASGISDVHPTCEKDFWVPRRIEDHPSPAWILKTLYAQLSDHPYAEGIPVIR